MKSWNDLKKRKLGVILRFIKCYRSNQIRKIKTVEIISGWIEVSIKNYYQKFFIYPCFISDEISKRHLNWEKIKWNLFIKSLFFSILHILIQKNVTTCLDFILRKSKFPKSLFFGCQSILKAHEWWSKCRNEYTTWCQDQEKTSDYFCRLPNTTGHEFEYGRFSTSDWFFSILFWWFWSRN